MFWRKNIIENKNTYLKIIEFCIDKNEWLTYENIKNWVDLSNQELWILEMNIIQAYEWNPSSIFHRRDWTLDASIVNYLSVAPYKTETHQEKVLKNGTSNTNIYFLTFEAVSSYYDYLELKEARINSKDARFWSITALLVSIITLLVSIYFSYKQLNNPINIDNNQLKILKSSSENIINQINNTNNKLDNNNQLLNNINSKLLEIINLK